MEEKGHLVCGNQIEMENRKATHEPDRHEAVNYEKIWQNIFWNSLQKFFWSIDNVDPRKYKHV